MDVDPEAILQEVDRLAASQELVRSHKLVRFIRFTVQEMLEGSDTPLTEYRIATEVYGRSPDFDSQMDGIVRTEARRLRRKLAHYYANDGRDDPLILEYPVGSYMPIFRAAGNADQFDFLGGGGEMAERIRRFDWTSTPLGPLESWPHTMRIALGDCLRSQFPCLLCWGKDLLIIYNDAKAKEIGPRHPSSLAKPAAAVFPNSWGRFAPLVDRVLQRGESLWAPNERFLLDTHGYEEERYFTLLFSPISDGNGGKGGVLVATNETTRQVISERRVRLLGEIATHLSHIDDAAAACRIAASVMKDNPYDIPFACLYLIRAGEFRTAKLEATCGIGPNTQISQSSVGLDESDHGVLARAFRGGARQVIDIGETLPDLPSGAWRAPSTSIGVLPLEVQGYSNPAGFLVTGINPHRQLDADYRAFLEALAAEVGRAIDRARAADEEKRRIEHLASLDRARTDFFHKVDSELRNLSMLLLGPLDHATAAGEAPGGQRSGLDITRRNELRLLKRINALLDFAALETGRSETFFVPVDLSAITADVAGTFRDAIERAGVRLLIDCPPLGAPAYVDRDIWEKIVLNLISNAFKFTLRGEIGVSLRLAGNRFDLTVWDTGAGIPASKLATLFDHFHSSKAGRARTSEGLGMGLPLVRDYARLHGGSVKILSEEGEGTSLIVSIPAGHAHLPQDRVGRKPGTSFAPLTIRTFVEEALSWSEGEASVERTAQEAMGGWSERAISGHSDARILIVNNNAEMRDYFARLLGGVYTVDTAADAEQAFAAAVRNRPDLVVADTSLSDNGSSLIRALRTDRETESIPVLVLSAIPAEAHRLRAFVGGADDYLLKPFTARELLFRIQAQVILYRTRERAKREQERLRAEAEAQRVMLEAVLDQMPAGVVIAKAPSREILSENRTAAKLLGRSFIAAASVEPKRTWIGYRPDGTQYGPDEWPLTRSMGSGEPVTDEEIEYVRPDGEHRHVLANAGPVRDSEGRIIAGVLAFQDITERKRIENALRAGERRFRQILDTVTEGIWCVDLNGRTIACNKVMEQMVGFTMEELQELTPFDLVFEEDWEKARRQFERNMSGYETPFDFRFRHKNGSAVLLTHMPKLLRDEKGRPEAILCRIVPKASNMPTPRRILAQGKAAT